MKKFLSFPPNKVCHYNHQPHTNTERNTTKLHFEALPTGKRNLHFDYLRNFHPLDSFVVIRHADRSEFVRPDIERVVQPPVHPLCPTPSIRIGQERGYRILFCRFGYHNHGITVWHELYIYNGVPYYDAVRRFYGDGDVFGAAS